MEGEVVGKDLQDPVTSASPAVPMLPLQQAGPLDLGPDGQPSGNAERIETLFPSSRLDWGVNDQRRGAGCLSCLQWP